MGALERYQQRVSQKMRPAWRPPLFSEFAQDVEVLSFDQTLNRTGYVCLAVRDARVDILLRGTLRPKPGELTSFAQTFDLADQLDGMLSMLDFRESWRGKVVIEMPPTGGKRIESSLLAAYVLHHHYSRSSQSVSMISIQKARTILGGSLARDDKKGGHEALAEYVPESTSRKWNEHQRDAAINGLGYLYTIAQEGS